MFVIDLSMTKIYRLIATVNLWIKCSSHQKNSSETVILHSFNHDSNLKP